MCSKLCNEEFATRCLSRLSPPNPRHKQACTIFPKTWRPTSSSVCQEVCLRWFGCTGIQISIPVKAQRHRKKNHIISWFEKFGISISSITKFWPESRVYQMLNNVLEICLIFSLLFQRHTLAHFISINSKRATGRHIQIVQLSYGVGIETFAAHTYTVAYASMHTHIVVPYIYRQQHIGVVHGNCDLP